MVLSGRPGRLLHSLHAAHQDSLPDALFRRPFPKRRIDSSRNRRDPMRIRNPRAARIFACCLLSAVPAIAFAQASPPAKPPVGTTIPPAQVYGHLLTQLESEFVGAAEAMPEDKFDFAPSATAGEFKGVRTFSAQVKHVAEANYFFFGGPNFTEADDKAKSDAIEKLK